MAAGSTVLFQRDQSKLLHCMLCVKGDCQLLVTLAKAAAAVLRQVWEV
jgi:hypothetical protein